jgi:phosphopantetheinyl transferase (holo-ACP synthase)
LRIGNDIVDLLDPEAHPGAVHPRFVARILAESETRSEAPQTNALRPVWRLWACKEAAYKAVARDHPGLPFSPRSFEVELGPPDRRAPGCRRHCCVRWQGRVLCGEVEETARWIHAVVCEDAAGAANAAPAALYDLRRVVAACGGAADASLFVRRLVIDEAAASLGLCPSRVSVHGRRPPWLAVDGVRRAALSISHHGAFVAAAWESGVFLSRSRPAKAAAPRSGRTRARPGTR